MINGAKVVLLKAGAETIPNQVSRAPNHTANLLGLVLRCIETALQLNTSIEIHFAAFFKIYRIICKRLHLHRSKLNIRRFRNVENICEMLMSRFVQCLFYVHFFILFLRARILPYAHRTLSALREIPDDCRKSVIFSGKNAAKPDRITRDRESNFWIALFPPAFKLETRR